MPTGSFQTAAEFGITFLLGIISAGIGSFFAVRSGLRQFYSEKRWERRAQAYDAIVEALTDLLEYCEVEQARCLSSADEPESDKKVDILWRQAIRRVKKAYYAGNYYVREDASQVIKTLIERPDPDWEKDLWSAYNENYKAYRDALDAIILIAKSDLHTE